MQKKKQKQTKPVKQILILIIAVILVLLLIFAEDIIKLTNKNKLNLAENTENELISNEPNIPVLSAGMIPVKWDGTNWIITTAEDKDWYDYSKGKPAYIMLNDGAYQSELLRDMTNKELAENNVGVGVPDDPQTRGSIYLWIPRFAYNENGDIKYLKGIESADGNWTIPETFIYEQASETVPDFLLTGVWMEKDVDTAYTTKITGMNQEESIYGFIKNTIAVSSDQTTQNEIQQYIANTVGADASVRPQIIDPTNPNRIILKIINQNNQDPIKAKGSYNKYSALMTIQVTYTKNGINKIVLEDENELEFSEANGIITANTTGIELEDGDYTITITDNKNNKKKLTVKVINAIYAVYYTDGTLAFGKNNNPLPEKTRENSYDISNLQYTNEKGVPWYSAGYYNTITTVNFVNKISPNKTSYWFVSCSNLTTIYNANNLNTSNVIDMAFMFFNCGNLTNLDTSSWDTSKVTNMRSMFYACGNLTTLNLKNWNTSKVTNMSGMFYYCTNLNELDLSNFNTSRVTDMSQMFNFCSGVTSLDIGNFDTSNVTTMYRMFISCSSLSELDVSSFNTKKVTNMSYMFQSCSNLKNLDLSKFNTSNVTSMAGMFSGCSNLTNINLTSFNTSNVIEMNGMFSGCGIKSLNLGNFNTSKVTNMSWMFSNCKNLTSLDLSKFNTSRVTTMYYMFSECTNLTNINVSNFNTNNVTEMGQMFRGCRSLTSIDVSSFNVSNASMQSMFQNCSKLKTIYVSRFTSMWPNNITNSSSGKYQYIFSGCGTSTVTRK